jgi:putative ABC transport system ATP-binding protein
VSGIHHRRSRSELLSAIHGRAVTRRAQRRAESTGEAIKVRGLTKRYRGEGAVLDEADLDVAHGDFVVVTGASGAGKSTLMHLLAALERPDAGSIVVNGIDLTSLRQQTRYRRFEIGMIFQLHNLVPRLTAEQNVAMAMFGTGLSRKERAALSLELLEQVGLSHRVGSKPPTMSGGERQRVAIARALANDPPVLLADEPTGSLDDESAASVLDLFSELRRDAGITILAVSHDPRLNATADRLVRLAGGHLVETVPAPAVAD